MSRIPAAVPAQLSIAVSVARWLEELSPQAVAQYCFTGYDSLLSHLAMELLMEEDFALLAGQEAPTVQNLRAALAELYAGSTCTLTRVRNRFTLALTVPGGARDTWPSSIPQPGPITYPNRGRVAHG